MFLLDGESFENVVRIVSLEEKFDILNGDNSGRSQSGDMYLEYVGTYFNYAVTFKRKNAASLSEWDRFKNILAKSHNEHIISILHDQTLLKDYHIYIARGQRKLISTKHIQGDQYESEWGDLSVEFTAMEPIDENLLT